MRNTTIILTLIAVLSLAGYSTSWGNDANRDSLGIGSPYHYFERPIDPDHYIIRPGEQITVTFVKTKLPSLKLTIDAEGRVVDQTLGVIDLVDHTLTEARQVLSEKLSRIYNSQEIVISIANPIPVTVSVVGAVNRPGRYQAFSSQRVSEIIDSAGGIADGGSTRLIRFIGPRTERAVDLDRAGYLGDPATDPCLYSGYSVVVPPRSDKIVFVDGAVNNPREIELGDTESIVELIALAGGPTVNADVESAYITNELTGEHDTASDVRAGSIIMVPSLAEKSGTDFVSIYGAVNRAGMVPFQEGMTLAQLMAKADGPVRNANPDRATIFRRTERDAQGRRLVGSYPIATLSFQGGWDQIRLEKRDSIFVPARLGYIKITGQVRFPGLYPFDEGLDAASYITRAGGYVEKVEATRLLLFDRVSRTTIEVNRGAILRDGDELTVELLGLER